MTEWVTVVRLAAHIRTAALDTKCYRLYNPALSTCPDTSRNVAWKKTVAS